tara:strand:- start:86 stop:301 length:216 start_codon:yes stop_codon:yes gene_type:complete
MPAADLVAKCSSLIEEYHIGSSKPWKSTRFAPDSTCEVYRAVLTGAYPMARGEEVRAISLGNSENKFPIPK